MGATHLSRVPERPGRPAEAAPRGRKSAGLAADGSPPDTPVRLCRWRIRSASRGLAKKTMRRQGAKNADYRGGVTCLDDTQLLGACLHASESGGSSRPEAVRGMPDVPIAPPATGPQY